MPVPAIDPTTKRYTENIGGALVGTVAAAGTVIGNSAALAYGFNNVTGANDSAGVQLPVAFPGAEVTVYNGNGNGLKVYPQVNSAIVIPSTNSGVTNSAVAIDDFSTAIFRGINSTAWSAIYTANS
jgi:hypothetical protein